MKHRFLIVFLIGVLFLTACSQVSRVSEDSAVAEATDLVQEQETDKKSGSQEEAGELPDSKEKESEPLEALSPTESSVRLATSEGCREKDPIAIAYDVLSPPNDNDWISGPEDALITVIEYGDFQ